MLVPITQVHGSALTACLPTQPVPPPSARPRAHAQSGEFSHNASPRQTLAGHGASMAPTIPRILAQSLGDEPKIAGLPMRQIKLID